MRDALAWEASLYADEMRGREHDALDLIRQRTRRRDRRRQLARAALAVLTALVVATALLVLLLAVYETT